MVVNYIMADWFGQLLTEIGSGGIISGAAATIINITIIVLLGFFVAKASVSILKRIFRIQSIKRSLKQTGYRIGLEKLLTSILKYTIYFFIAIAVLSQVGLSAFIIQLITAMIVLLILLIVVLSLERSFPNLYAGLYIKKSKIIKKGDTVKIKNIKGIVERIDFVNTTITTKRGIVVVPNETVVKGGVVKINV